MTAELHPISSRPFSGRTCHLRLRIGEIGELESPARPGSANLSAVATQRLPICARRSNLGLIGGGAPAPARPTCWSGAMSTAARSLEYLQLAADIPDRAVMPAWDAAQDSPMNREKRQERRLATSPFIAARFVAGARP